jgi:hypothetical protein
MSQTVTPSYSLNASLGYNPGLARLYDNVQAIVPAVDLPLIQMMAWNVIQDFYQQSTAKREIVFWQMAPGVSQLDFNPFDANWLVAWVMNVTGLTKFKIDMPATITDLHNPSGPRHGEVTLALVPVNFNADLPPELFSQWFETILDGVLFRLYSTPTKPYSSPQLAIYHGKRYRKGIAQAKGVAQHGFTSGGGIWQFPHAQSYATGRRKN